MSRQDIIDHVLLKFWRDEFRNNADNREEA
jgi:hypothetical protein